MLNRPRLERRINIEHYAASQANLIVASSNDEVLDQYGLYSAQLTEKCAVNPPGCELELFSAPAVSERVAEVGAEISRFLSHPGRPALLALAAPRAAVSHRLREAHSAEVER